MIMAKYVAYGDRTDPQNPFAWEQVVLNLPGSESYDPSLPWVMKIRSDGHLACEVFVYVDDGRITGWSPDPDWEEEGRPFQVAITVTQLKWDKTKALVSELWRMILEDSEAMDRERLEQVRGFLVYVARTYRWMNPYLKGLHLTIDGWRPDRDEEGYRIPRGNRAGVEEEEGLEIDDAGFRLNEAAVRRAEKDLEEGREVDWNVFRVKREELDLLKAPAEVRAVPRLRGDVDTLQEFLAGDTPAVQKCRVSSVAVALYLMGDASGVGYRQFELRGYVLQGPLENFSKADGLDQKAQAAGKEARLHNTRHPHLGFEDEV